MLQKRYFIITSVPLSFVIAQLVHICRFFPNHKDLLQISPPLKVVNPIISQLLVYNWYLPLGNEETCKFTII